MLDALRNARDSLGLGCGCCVFTRLFDSGHRGFLMTFVELPSYLCHILTRTCLHVIIYLVCTAASEAMLIAQPWGQRGLLRRP